MEEKKELGSSSSSKDLDKSEEKTTTNTVSGSSSSIRVTETENEQKTPSGDSQTKQEIAGPESEQQKMEAETSRQMTPSDVDQTQPLSQPSEHSIQSPPKQRDSDDRTLEFASSSRIESRRAGVPEYFGECDIPVYHKVKFTICLSFGMVYKQIMAPLQTAEKKSKPELPVALGFFHVEFRLLPTDNEPTQIDVVPYNTFARIFFDKNESRTVKYHYDGNYSWVIWNQMFEVDITNDLLVQLFDYSLEVNVWNTKDKLMTRTRFDKPRYMKIDVEEAEGKKQVDFQKEWLNDDDRNSLSADANGRPKSPKLKEESSTNIAPTESEAQLEIIRAKFTGLPSNKTDTSSSSNKKASTQKDFPASKGSVRLQYFYSGICAVTKRIDKPLEGMVELLTTISLNKSLLSEHQKRNLNPMVITIHSVQDMPGTSDELESDYTELKNKCYPAYLKYQFMKQKPYISPGKSQQKEILFNDVNVILTGDVDRMELREFFLGPGLLIEIHDRDKRPSKIGFQPLLFGDDLNDEKFSNIGVITSKKTKLNPYKSPLSSSLDPYGVSRFDLSGFTLGQKFCFQELPILNSPAMDSLQSAEADNLNFVKKVNPELSKDIGPFKPGNYINSCSMMVVTIQLSYPIIIPPVTNPRPAITPTYNCPFGRMVFVVGNEKQEFLEKILLVIAKINGLALGLNDVPDNILIATLLTLITTKHQRFDRLLDIITGFHIIDDMRHVLVVEGLQLQGIQTLIDNFGDIDYSDVKILFDTNLVYSDRLYASFDVVLRKVKLLKPLEAIVQQPLIYIRDMVPKFCYDALILIYELCRCNRLIDAFRNKLFPSANMVRSLSKEFGVVIKEENFKMDASTPFRKSQKKKASLLTTLTEEKAATESVKCKSLDNYNKPYMKMLKRNLHSAPANFVTRNIDFVNSESQKVKEKREPINVVHLSQPLAVVHNYGSSTFNVVEKQKSELRQQLDPKSMYSYCPDFHNSMTFAPMELEEIYKQEEIHKRQKWMTPTGWIYPGLKTSLDCYVHPKKPSITRIKELSLPYGDRTVVCDPRERCAFTWSERALDMDIWRQPTYDPCDKVYFLGCSLDKNTAEDKEKAETWKRKVIVKNTRTRIHRKLVDTELQPEGRLASCQLDKMKGLLKDKPIRRALKYRPVDNISSLNVVSYPELITADMINRKKLKSYYHGCEKSAYGPGPYWPERSLSLFGNHTQMYDYDHVRFADSKGADFKSLYKAHDPIHKGKLSVPPISEEEKNTEFRKLKNCLCHRVPESWKEYLFYSSDPPPVDEPYMESSIFNDHIIHEAEIQNMSNRYKMELPTQIDC